LSAVALDVAAVRARFSALDRPTAFFDAPGGTQTPDSVIEAIAGYLRESNANLGGAFETSRRSDALVVSSHHTAARFLGCDPDEVGFGQNMTTLNFALTRTLGRELRAGDEIVVTRLDHDGNVSPWLQLADDLDLVVRFVNLNEDDATLDLDDLERQLGEQQGTGTKSSPRNHSGSWAAIASITSEFVSLSSGSASTRSTSASASGTSTGWRTRTTRTSRRRRSREPRVAATRRPSPSCSR